MRLECSQCKTATLPVRIGAGLHEKESATG